MAMIQPGHKQCPMCAEQIKSEATVCRFCGYDYRTGTIASRPTKYNGLAIASLVLGIVWVYWIGSILSIIFGHVALNQIKKSGGTQQGRGMAIAGLVLGYMGIAVLVFIIVVLVVASTESGVNALP